jgi:hypothetical protein
MAMIPTTFLISHQLFQNFPHGKTAAKEKLENSAADFFQPPQGFLNNQKVTYTN